MLPATQAKVLLRITFDPLLTDEIAHIVPKFLAVVGREFVMGISVVFFRRLFFRRLFLKLPRIDNSTMGLRVD